MTPNISADELLMLKHKVYQAARDGRAISIFAMLWNLDRESIVNEVLNHKTDEDGQCTTPLIIAARNGEEKVVQVLLTNFDADIEQTGTVKFDGYSIEGATSLWCSAGAGHFAVVKLLIEHKADVNHPTMTNSTPLRAACFDGRLDIVKYLVDNKADLTVANKYKNTCLMISCYKGHKEVVKYLLEQGSDPDCRAHCGATALHFSAECGQVEIVRLLVQHEAAMLENDNHMTPLMIAAECGQSEVVEYLTSREECSTTEKIDAFELLGASYANDKEYYNIEKAYLYLHKGMEERFKDPNNIIKKEQGTVIPAYDNRIECQSLQELEAIKDNHPILHMEALAIRERVLGSDNPEVPHPIIFRGAVFADGSRFDRCISLWLHALQLRQSNNRSISKDLLRFAQVFSQMVHLGAQLLYSPIHEVFVHATMEMVNDKKRITKGDEDLDTLQEIYEENIHTCIYLLVIMLKFERTEVETEELHKCVYRFLQQNPHMRNGYTPLHMGMDSATIVDDFHVNDVVKFPSGYLCRLLIACGANVNARDNLGNTPMHIIVKYTNPISDFESLHQCMISLLKNGAHLDIRNGDGKTALETSVTGVAEVILITNNQISLKCLAAQVIQRHKLPYKNNIPVILEDFIELH